MSRLSEENLRIATKLLIDIQSENQLNPLLHLAQEQEGWVTDEAMNHIAEIIGITPAEVLGTCSFYEMFKRQPNGEYQVNICHGISCHLLGADQLIHHAEETLGIREGETTPDGKFTLEGVECIAACTEAPCMQINYRYQNQINESQFDEIVKQIQAGEKTEIPKHGALAKIRQHIPAESMAGFQSIDESSEPVWLKRNGEAE